MKIAVVCGGTSPEREVSLSSGRAVAEALQGAGHDVLLSDVTKPRDFVAAWKETKAECVFVAMHGGWGEDGRLQTCLEAFGIPYTGSGPSACLCAMDKRVSRCLMASCGVSVPDGYAKERGSAVGASDIAMLKKYGTLVTKPNGGGSSTNVSFVTSADELAKGLELAWSEGGLALVERYIPGREVTVPVWEKEDGEVIALPAIDIRPKDGFYNYKNKYTHGCTEYICPAKFPKKTYERLNAMAVAAHKSLGCRVYSRVDFRVTEDDDIYALEVNTAPGMTGTSLVPKAARSYGLSFAEFLESVIRVSFSIQRSF